MHRRFGHQSVFGSKDVFCETCALSRRRKKGISEHGKVKYVSADRIMHTLMLDLQGLFSFVVSGKKVRYPSVGGYLYTFPVMDEYSRFVWMELIHSKDEAANKLIVLLKKLRNKHYHTPIVRLHSDGGSEFINQTVVAYLNSVGIAQTYTTRKKPSHNGKVERFNQTMNKIVRSFMVESRCPFRMWNYCVLYATYVYNRTPLGAIDGVSPYERLYGTEPKLNKIVPFGCDAYYALKETAHGKLQSINARAVFIGISEAQNAYLLMSVHENKIGRLIVTRDVSFNQSSYSHMLIYSRWIGHQDRHAKQRVVGCLLSSMATVC